jgi:Reverse transcriptase (RNA-dependent DNA polymerase)/RNase H-like domain found in reverse transcriptase
LVIDEPQGKTASTRAREKRWDRLCGKPHELNTERPTEAKASAVWTRHLDTRGWPIHAKSVGKIRSILFEELLREWSDAADTFALLFDERRYAACETAQFTKWPRSTLSRCDLEQLLAAGAYVVVPREEAEHYTSRGYIFKVAEITKQRFRPVHDTLTANLFAGDPQRVAFTPLPRVRQFVKMYDWAASFDFTAFFHQIPLAERLQKYFAAKVNGLFVAPTHLPMGYKGSVSIANTISAYIAFRATRGLNVTFDTYVDNIIFMSRDRAQVRAASERFRAECAFFGVTIGDQTPARQELEYRGLRLDFARGTVQLAGPFVDKLVRKWAWIRDGEQCSWAELRSLTGTVTYGCLARGKPLAPLFDVYRFAATCSRQNTPLNRRLALPEQVKAALRRQIAEMTANEPITTPSMAQDPPSIFTDASDHTWGAVFVSAQGLRFTRGTFDSAMRQCHINIKEAFGVLQAVAFWKHLLHHRWAHLYTDNMVVMYALKKTISRSYTVNAVIAKILQDLSDMGAELTVSYVPSAKNPADPLTRGGTEADAQKLVREWFGASRACGFGGGGGERPCSHSTTPVGDNGA